MLLNESDILIKNITSVGIMFIKYISTSNTIIAFPHPGGPHNIMLGISFFSSKDRRIFLCPKTCSCPMKSDSSDGRICSASGIPERLKLATLQPFP